MLNAVYVLPAFQWKDRVGINATPGNMLNTCTTFAYDQFYFVSVLQPVLMSLLLTNFLAIVFPPTHSWVYLALADLNESSSCYSSYIILQFKVFRLTKHFQWHPGAHCTSLQLQPSPRTPCRYLRFTCMTPSPLPLNYNMKVWKGTGWLQTAVTRHESLY